MKIQIRSPDVKLSIAQRTELERQLGLSLGRFGTRIDRVIVRVSEATGIPGYKRCQIEVTVRPTAVSAEHCDISVSLAVEHAANRVARSVRRTIEDEARTVNR